MQKKKKGFFFHGNRICLTDHRKGLGFCTSRIINSLVSNKMMTGKREKKFIYLGEKRCRSFFFFNEQTN